MCQKRVQQSGTKHKPFAQLSSTIGMTTWLDAHLRPAIAAWRTTIFGITALAYIVAIVYIFSKQ